VAPSETIVRNQAKMEFPKGGENPENLFVQSTGAVYKSFFNDVNSATGLKVTSCQCRKYAASAAKDESGEVREKVCRAMKHSSKVRDANYVYRTKQAAID